MKKIRWGIIGTGHIAHKFAAALKMCGDCELKAAASRSYDKAENFAAEFGFEKAYGSYSELSLDSEIDCVYVATPMASHFNDVMLCLENGRNVLCEKTVAMNMSELEKMHETAKANGLFFMEAMWMKCRPVYLKAIEWVKTGRIGDVRLVKADFSNKVPYDPESRLFRKDCGGGALLDLAVYPITLALDVLGNDPEEVITAANIGKDGVDLSNSIILKYSSGKYASLYSGFEMPLSNNAMISGTDGIIIFGNYFHCTDEVVLYDRNCSEVERFSVHDEVNGYEYEIREANRCIASGMTESKLVPYSGTAASMKIIDTCREKWKI